jgi:fructose-1,6-bisphosphatase
MTDTQRDLRSKIIDKFCLSDSISNSALNEYAVMYFYPEEFLEILAQMSDKYNDNILERFCINVAKHSKKRNLKLTRKREMSLNLIGRSFAWSSTNEKFKYWDKINNQFKQIYKKKLNNS